MKGLGEIFIGVSASVAVFVYCTAVGSAIDIPDVHVSNSTGECVKVINYAEDDEYTCNVLPSKYNHVWVK